ADVVEALQETMLAVALDVEIQRLVAGQLDLLAFQIDAQPQRLVTTGSGEQAVDVSLRQAHWQNAVLEAVVVEDVGKARSDHAAETEVVQCPDGVFARRTAAEIFLCQQDAGPTI